MPDARVHSSERTRTRARADSSEAAGLQPLFAWALIVRAPPLAVRPTPGPDERRWKLCFPYAWPTVYKSPSQPPPCRNTSASRTRRNNNDNDSKSSSKRPFTMGAYISKATEAFAPAKPAPKAKKPAAAAAAKKAAPASAAKRTPVKRTPSKKAATPAKKAPASVKKTPTKRTPSKRSSRK